MNKDLELTSSPASPPTVRARQDGASSQSGGKRRTDAKQMAELALEVGDRGYGWKQRALRLEEALFRARTVLASMAKENEGAMFNRWPIHHEPLRADARHLLPVIDEALSANTDRASAAGVSDVTSKGNTP